MRTIKFRAWDKFGHQMINHIKWVQFDHNSNFILIRSEYDLNVKNGENSDEYERYANHVDLMQFTGFLDKNGKEVYEGDIIKTQVEDDMNWGDDDEKRIFTDDAVTSVIEWNDEASGYFLPSSLVVDDYLPSLTDESLYFEVIGNIYENPELLTKSR